MSSSNSRLGWLNPLRRPKWLEGLAEAEIEDISATWSIAAIKAMHVGIVISSVTFMGLFLQAFKVLVGPEQYNSVTWLTIKQQVSLEELPGLLLFIWGAWVGLKYLAEFLTRMLVQLLGFSFSITPGSIIRKYVYTASTKVWLFLLALPFLGAYGILWYFGLRGLMEFLVPRFALWFDKPYVFWALAFSYVAAFLFFPAMRVKIQEDVELLELLTFNEIVVSHKSLVKLRRDLIEIAAPQMATAMLRDLQTRGPEALGDWATLPRSYWHKTAESLGMSKKLLAGTKRLQYKPKPGGGYYLANTTTGGQVTVYDADQFGGIFEPPSEAHDEQAS